MAKAARKSFSVKTDSEAHKLNVRANPSLDAPVLTQLAYGEKVKIDPKAETPAGWLALEAGGFVMAQYLK